METACGGCFFYTLIQKIVGTKYHLGLWYSSIEGGDRITDRQKKFAEEYVKLLDGGKAYMAAGYNCSSRKRAIDHAARLKKNPEVKEYINTLFKKARKRNEIDMDRIIALLGAVAFSSPADMGKIVEENGEQKFVWKDTDELEEDVRRAIAIIKNTKCGIEIETLDRLKAIDMLLKHLGMDQNAEGGVIISGENELE